MEETQMLTNAEIGAELESLRGTKTIFNILGYGCLFGAVIMLIMGKLLFFIIFIVAAIFCFGRESDASKKIKRYFAIMSSTV